MFLKYKNILLKFIFQILKYKTNYYYKNIKIALKPNLFPLYLTFSTKILLKYCLNHFELKNKKCLELGCGHGLISLYLAKRNAVVWATDINPLALDNLKYNAQQNKVSVNRVLSDLFEKISENNFDLILINPPYYPKKFETYYDMAWFCGENFEYYSRLFVSLHHYLMPNTTCLMVLSSNAPIHKIIEIGIQYNIKYILCYSKSIFITSESILIYKLAIENYSA